MNPTKWNLVSMVMLSLIFAAIQTPSKQNPEQSKHHSGKRHASASSQSFNTPSYWEHILREFVFKTISPPPSGNHQLYRRLLEAPFYGGPFPIVSNDAANVVLSRGDVYQLPSGLWLFCQQGCVECGVCIDHTHPTVKWVLRRIKRTSSHGAARHDLQLTILPQVDGSYHTRSLWPQTYVYVTSEGEQDIYMNDKHSYHSDGTAYIAVENDFSGQRKPGNFWSYVDKNSLPQKRIVGNSTDDIVSKKRNESDVEETLESTSAMPKKDDAEINGEKRNDLRNVKRQRPELKVTREKENLNGSSKDVESKENLSESSKDVALKENVSGSSKDVRSRENGSKVKQSIPKLILGTDQMGQKHLVHVVPADGSTNTSLMNSAVSNILNAAGRNRTAYQRILRRIFDSLNNNRRSIESFLEPLTSTEKLSRQEEEHQLQETRNDFPGFGAAGRLYPLHSKENKNESSFEKRWPYTLNWNRERTTSSDNAFANKFVNNTINFGRKSNNGYTLNLKMQNNIAENKNISNRFHSRLSEDNYSNSTFHNNFKINNISRNSQEYRFSPRRYKILVTTESTTKFDDITKRNKS